MQQGHELHVGDVAVEMHAAQHHEAKNGPTLMCGILGIKKLPVASTTKSYTSSLVVGGFADSVTTVH